jgi:AcrR family transcriptional regulator
MRLRLAQAAFELIAERGISALRTAAVVDRVGVSQGALLHHFPNKQALTEAAIDFMLEKELQRSLSIVEAQRGQPARLALASMIADFRAFFLNPCFWATLDTTMDGAKDDTLLLHIRAIVQNHRQPVYKAWAEILIAAGWTHNDADDIVRMTAAIISGIAMRSLWQDIDQILDRSLETWVDIIGQRWPLPE